MRFLSREWATGGLPDDEWEERLSSFRRRVEELRGLLGHGAEALLEDVNLHDAQPHSFQVADDTVALQVLAGDLQHGYEWIELRYVGAAVGSADEVLAWIDLPGCEVLYDEVDVSGDEYVHRLLLDPVGEFTVRFQALEVHRAPAIPDDRR